MMDRRKAPAAAATTTEATETALQGSNTAPAHNSNSGAGNGQVLELISIGRENAQTAAELARVSGLTPRQVTAQVQAARLHGARICSSNGIPAGYWYAENPAELDRNIKQLTKREVEQRRTIEAMERTRDGWTGQDRMEGF